MSAWLATLELNPRNRAVRVDLADVDCLHKRMMTLVPQGLGDQARRRAGLLFRVEERDRRILVLVQARLPVDVARLPEGYAHAEVRDLVPVFNALAKGQGVRYRIAANASKREALPIGAAEQWWRRRAEQAGLHLLSVISSPAGAVRGGAAIRHDLTRFDGVALVEDPEAVTAAVLDGIGRGKSYGGGLLSLAPARVS
jgi:CRISPR system Cascade subunit CasE